MEIIPKTTRHFMPFSFKVKPCGLQPKDLDAQKFNLLILVLLWNRFSIQLLGKGRQGISCVWPNLHAGNS